MLKIDRKIRHENPELREFENPEYGPAAYPQGQVPAPWVVVGSSTTLYYPLIWLYYLRLYTKYLDFYLSGTGDLGVLRATCIALRTQRTIWLRLALAPHR